MSTLYIRLPSKVAADSAQKWLALACPFALVSHRNEINLQGIVPLSDLSDLVAKSQRVVLLLAASDVTLLRVKVPPLSSARLKAALPNLAEDQLIADPAECVIVAGSMSEGLRTIAVVQHSWLELLSRTFTELGAGHISALPAQYCLSFQPGIVTAAIFQHDTDTDLTLRLSEHDGIGLAIAPDPNQTEGREQNESAAREIIRTLRTIVPNTPVKMYVPESLMRTYQEAVNDTDAQNNRIDLFADNWSNWIAGAGSTTLDMMAGFGAGTGTKLNWRPWRWPLALATAVLVINAAALNIDWWRMKGETNALRAAMIQIYKLAYPNESVIIDPIAQMQQKIAAAKHSSGLASADDFTAITATLGEVLANEISVDKTSVIAALEYHDRSLLVRLKKGGEATTQQLKAALAKRALALELVAEQSGTASWQIRSAK